MRGVCTFEGCERPHKARGLCAAHYLQQSKNKPLTPIQQWKGPRGNRLTGPGTCCTVDGCKKVVHSGGLCSMHRWRMHTHGDLDTCTTNRYIPMLDRFWMKVVKTPTCWNWEGGGRGGYGIFTSDTKTHLAHRLAYELLVGPIPDGKVLDHKCRNTLCVNPAHLRPVTRKQNREHVAGAQRNSSTGVLGVIRRKRDGRYVGQVGHNGRIHNVPGSFANLDEAAEAVRQLRLSLFTHNDLDRMKESAQ